LKGLFVFSNKMEDVEGLATRALLVRSGLDITTTNLSESKRIVTSFGQPIETDTTLDEITPDDYDFLIIPGGPYVKESVDADTRIKALAKDFFTQDKLIAAICAGPRFLGQAGILDEKHYTAFTGSDKDAPKGHYHPHEKALRDGNIITARGAGAVYEFAYEIIKATKGEEAAAALLKQILH